MSPIGHTVSAFAMSTTYLQINDVSLIQVFSSLPKVIMSGNLANADQPAFVALVALGILLGARGPDRMEIPSFNRRTNTRHSVIPHRTITHWPTLWIVMTAICWAILSLTHDFLLYNIACVAMGFCVAGWLHLTMDIMTPMGIPLLTPFGPRFSFKLYKTSQTGELVCLFLFSIICYLSVAIKSLVF